VLKAPGQVDLSSPADQAAYIRAYNFDCDGSYDEKNDIWWLSTSNPFKFKKRFSGQWYFDKLSRNMFAGDHFVVKMLIPAYTQRPDRGGKPTSGEVRVAVKNPQTDEEFVISGVRVGFTREGIELPSYVYVPIGFISDDGRVIVEVGGLGQIGVSESRLALLAKV